MARQTLSSAKLYAVLDREFRKRKAPDCRKCRVPLPFYKEPADEVSANWHIGTPSECPHQCQVIIAEVLASLWPRYNLEAPEELDA
jgi:hypothetical protein